MALRDPELEAIRKICMILDRLEMGQRQRVIEYAAHRAGRPELSFGPLFPTNGSITAATLNSRG